VTRSPCTSVTNVDEGGGAYSQCAACETFLAPDDCSCPSCGSRSRNVFVSETVVLEDRISELDQRGADGTQTLYSSPTSNRTSKVSVSSDGTVSGTVQRGPSPGESNSRFVCETLEATLRGDGDVWLLDPDAADRDDDCKLSRDGRTLGVQVTRAHRVVAAWRDLAQTGSVAIDSNLDALAVSLIEAIRSKASKATAEQRRRQMLALDASDITHYVLDAPVARFRDRYGQEAAEAGYFAVWLVGPSPSKTHRLA
jgi:hypothetical protein